MELHQSDKVFLLFFFCLFVFKSIRSKHAKHSIKTAEMPQKQFIKTKSRTKVRFQRESLEYEYLACKHDKNGKFKNLFFIVSASRFLNKNFWRVVSTKKKKQKNLHRCIDWNVFFYKKYANFVIEWALCASSATQNLVDSKTDYVFGLTFPFFSAILSKHSCLDVLLYALD